MMFDVLSGPRLSGLRRAALAAAGSLIALSAVLTFSVSAFAQGPPIDGTTDPNDPRCMRTAPGENPFFLNMRTPTAGDPAPGSSISSWFSDESGLLRLKPRKTGPIAPVIFDLVGPGVSEHLTGDVSESFDQSTLFDQGHKECKIQVNIKTTIPATVNGGAYPPGDYTVTLNAWDNDQTRPPKGSDKGTEVWKFTIAAAVSPTPSPSSGVLAASTTGPGLPRTGAPVSAAPDRTIEVAVLFVLASIAAGGIAIGRSRRSRERA